MLRMLSLFSELSQNELEQPARTSPKSGFPMENHNF